VCQKPMPDAAQAIPFWTSVAKTFKGNNAVGTPTSTAPPAPGSSPTTVATRRGMASASGATCGTSPDTRHGCGPALAFPAGAGPQDRCGSVSYGTAGRRSAQASGARQGAIAWRTGLSCGRLVSCGGLLKAGSASMSGRDSTGPAMLAPLG
jgi:hypothetical protein